MGDSLEFLVYDELTSGGPNGTGPPLDEGVEEPLLRVVVELITYDEDFVEKADRLIVMLPSSQQKRNKKKMMKEDGLAGQKETSTMKTGPVVIDPDVDRRFANVLHVRGRKYTRGDYNHNSGVANDDEETIIGLNDGGQAISRQITVCRASRCASRVFVMANTSVRWRVINKALNRLRQRAGFRNVYDRRRWLYIVRSFGSRNFMVDIPFAFDNNVDA